MNNGLSRTLKEGNSRHDFVLGSPALTEGSRRVEMIRRPQHGGRATTVNTWFSGIGLDAVGSQTMSRRNGVAVCPNNPMDVT